MGYASIEPNAVYNRIFIFIQINIVRFTSEPLQILSEQFLSRYPSPARDPSSNAHVGQGDFDRIANTLQSGF